MSALPQAAGVRSYTIRFTGSVTAGDVVWMRFNQPGTSYACVREEDAGLDESAGADADDRLQVVIAGPGSQAQSLADWVKQAVPSPASPLVHIRVNGTELWWLGGRAALQGDEKLLPALVEFTHYERELSRIEAEMAAAWHELDEDKRLAFTVTPADLRRTSITAERMARAFDRRIRYARITPHLDAPDPVLPGGAQRLGEELRERARMESRAEAVAGQLETFEHIYEMSSQRIGEYQAARQGHLMEWVIIWLLAAEALLMLIQTVFRVAG